MEQGLGKDGLIVLEVEKAFTIHYWIGVCPHCGKTYKRESINVYVYKEDAEYYYCVELGTKDSNCPQCDASYINLEDGYHHIRVYKDSFAYQHYWDFRNQREAITNG